MIVSRILHAGYIFESAGVRIAFDPVFEVPFSTNCFPFPTVEFSADAVQPAGSARTVHCDSLHRYDAVFLSHFHDDHCSLVSLDAIPRSVPIYLYCVHGELFSFLRAMGFTVHALLVDEPVSVGGFVVTPRLALDSDVDAVYEIVAEGLAVLNVVDAWIDPSVLRLRSAWDLVLWPFQTMRELDALMPAAALRGSSIDADHETASLDFTDRASRELPLEWVEQLRKLRPRYVVPSSCQIRFEEWSWLNRAYFPITYAQFAREIPSSVRMNPGETFELTDSSFERVGRLPWVVPAGPQDVDYVFDDTMLSQVASASRDMNTLDRSKPSASATAGPRIAMTTSEIARKFPALSEKQRASVDRFCEGLDVTLYDHFGTATGSGSTEAIAYKIFRAITEGEQITSMYLRTDDIDNDELIAKLSADPLAFQRAQWKRLFQR